MESADRMWQAWCEALPPAPEQESYSSASLTTLSPALQALGTLLTDLHEWLQTEYARVGAPYGADEAGFSQWLAEVATEIQRQQTPMPQEQAGSYDLETLVVNAHVASNSETGWEREE